MNQLAEVKNAQDYKQSVRNWLLMGYTGSGKTSQLLTLPGKKFVYIFDPNAMPTLKGRDDIDYLEFYPDLLPLDVMSLATKKQVPQVIQVPSPTAWVDWERDFEYRVKEHFFQDEGYKYIGFEAMTMFQAMAMDRIADLNGRFGKWPHEDDYAPIMQSVESVFRTANTLGIGIFTSCHTEYKQDSKTKLLYNHPVMYGRLRNRLPTLFSEVLTCHVVTDSSGKHGSFEYEIQTKPDEKNLTVRTTLRNAKMFEDVTIGDWANPESFGLGKLLKQETN